MRSVAIANRHPRLKIDRRAITQAIHTLDAHHASLAAPGSVLGNEAELSLVFMTDRALAKLHADFLDDPSITDVITFEGDAMHGSAGEICVSADAARRHLGVTTTAARRGPAKTAHAFSAELTLYVVHGWLHLAGYDDLQPAKKRVMRRAEARAMTLLRKEGALPVFVWR